jgi:hypothetical protein
MRGGAVIRLANTHALQLIPLVSRTKNSSLRGEVVSLAIVRERKAFRAETDGMTACSRSAVRVARMR